MSQEKINHILLVDDDEIHSNLCYELILRAGIANSVTIFNDAEEALSYLRNNVGNTEGLPDLIFLDINMPFMDGWDFLDSYEEFREKMGKDIMLILLTSSVYKNDIEKAKQYKAVAEYIKTPISIDKLVQTRNDYFKHLKTA